ncbi:Alpha/Beta hydrolase protein [Mycena filopes]|nr:Alpha/Beta hydrolase protein [Mycena filopes]
MIFLCCLPLLPILLIAGGYIIMGVPAPFLRSHMAVMPIPAGQVSSFKPYSYFASAAYCDAKATRNWSCACCQANADFKPVATGGDGTSVQYWFVGYSPYLRSVIVGHQGTTTSSIFPLVTDITFAQESLDGALFPGMDPEIRVHSGFAGEHAKLVVSLPVARIKFCVSHLGLDLPGRTAAAVLAAVNSTLGAYNASRVAVIGHSLGAALALLDAVYLSVNLPASINFTTIGYGLPRVGAVWLPKVGNKNFADYVDAHTSLSLTRITNKKDPIPGVPEQVLGYEHPSGEIHIQETGQWNSCPGQDNANALCSVGEVEDLFEGNLSDHDGPYNGVRMGAAC